MSATSSEDSSVSSEFSSSVSSEVSELSSDSENESEIWSIVFLTPSVISDGTLTSLDLLMKLSNQLLPSSLLDESDGSKSESSSSEESLLSSLTGSVLLLLSELAINAK